MKVTIDRDSLLEKYSFVETYGPRMWLSEKDDGWYPSDINFFIDNMSPHSDSGKLITTTTIPLEGVYDKQEFFHG